MKTLHINYDIEIPETELEITTSRSGGAGGQHVNKTDTRVTIRWNALHTSALNDEQKARILLNLRSRLSTEGDLIVHNSESRSQVQNKKLALQNLAEEIRKALYVPKKRKPTKVTAAAKQSRLESKTQRSLVKKERSKRYPEE